jgi:hypothetical protein
MKRNLKRKHLSHERTKGSVDHGKGAAAKLLPTVNLGGLGRSAGFLAQKRLT